MNGARDFKQARRKGEIPEPVGYLRESIENCINDGGILFDEYMVKASPEGVMVGGNLLKGVSSSEAAMSLLLCSIKVFEAWLNPAFNFGDSSTDEISVQLMRNKDSAIFREALLDVQTKHWLEKNGGENVQLELEKHRLEKERHVFRKDSEAAQKYDERRHALLVASEKTQKKEFEAWLISKNGGELSKTCAERVKT